MKKTLTVIAIILLLSLAVWLVAPYADYLTAKQTLPDVSYPRFVRDWWKARTTEAFCPDNNLTYQGGELPEITVTPKK